MEAAFAYSGETRSISTSPQPHSSFRHVTPKKRTTNNLVALGAAGVVAVYAAGYVRTAAAAQRFSDESNERRPAPERDAPSPQGVVTAGQTSDARMAEKFGNSAPGPAAQTAKPATVVAPTTPNAPTADKAKVVAKPAVTNSPTNDDAVKAAIAAAASKAVVDTAKTVHNAGAASIAKGAPPASQPPAAATTMPPTAAVTTPPVTNANAANTSANATTTATAANTSASTTTAATTTTNTAPPATPPVTATEPAKTEKAPLAPGVKWRDGRYVGYGQSRHGDIEATIEIWEGKISYVAISQCLTQYSCSFIEKLPQQVFERQSANVDNVSGATQSSNAFYYAITQALQKAK